MVACSCKYLKTNQAVNSVTTAVSSTDRTFSTWRNMHGKDHGNMSGKGTNYYKHITIEW